jgi:hypothetical protein
MQPQFVKEPGNKSWKSLIGVLALLLALLTLAAVVFFGFLFMTRESGGSRTISSAAAPLAFTPLDQAMLGAPLPPGSIVRERERDDRGIDAFLLLKFTTRDADAVSFATTVTGVAPASGYSIQDTGPAWWAARPTTGRGANSDPSKSSVAKRVLLSAPDANGITTVWVMANET